LRNLIEFTSGDEDGGDYDTLTSLLHWKRNTLEITIGDYFQIYNHILGTENPTNCEDSLVDKLLEQALQISREPLEEGINLEKRIVLSTAIRLLSEKHMLERLRLILESPDYWCDEKNQFGFLFRTYKTYFGSSDLCMLLNEVSITVNSNIHINSFMYEPIIDMSISHLKRLYADIVLIQ